MTLNGHVENGQIVLDEAVPLSDGVKVRIELVSSDEQVQAAEEQAATLYDRYKSIIGIAKDLPPDFARNHDYYIHGLPKK